MTNLSEEEVINRIGQTISHSNRQFKITFFGINMNKAKKPTSSYIGKIAEKSFKISRNISYGNSFLPVIKGTVSSFLNKTEIRISMKMHLAVTIFMIFWLSLTGIVASFILITILQSLISFNFHGLGFPMLIPVMMFLFGYLMMLFGFKYEARKSKKELNILFEAASDKPF
ncbi:hypothetical protein [Fluviicola sp.]|uniref:hypothetical protein n=1 Tax=Fluviicola sp. TaxID=1917219 RepID=UPI002607A954|nr:hypothetical protein [Fluviicola sp.]